MLNDRQINLIKPPEKGRKSYGDINGLSLRVTSTNHKSWSIQYRVNGRKMRLTLGNYPTLSLKDARQLTTEKLNSIYKGQDPQHEKNEAKVNNFAYFVELYMEKHVRVNLKSRYEVERIFNNYFVSKLGRMPINKITKQHILRIIDALVVKGKGVQANRLLSYIKSMFKWCVQRDYLENNPIDSLAKPFKEKSRDRVLTLQEIKAIYEACRQVDPIQGDLVKFLILSGQRINEITNLKWSDIKDDSFEIPKERSKNMQKIITPLTTHMRDILSLVSKRDSYIFSYDGVKPLNCFSQLKKRLIYHSGISNWTYHDFRRSMGTFLGDNGFNKDRIMTVLNHTDSSVTSIYNRSNYFKQKLEALNFWNEHLINRGIGGGRAYSV